MRKQAFLFLSIFFLGCNLAFSQTYQITSFEGQDVKVNLSQKLFSKTLTVACLGDTVRFSDCTGLIKVTPLNEKFLQVIYGLRGGASFDLDRRNTLILSISNNKIKVSMLVQSYIGMLIGSEDHYVNCIYQYQLKLMGNNVNNYKMSVNIHGDRKLASGDIEKNINKQYSLKFDQNRKFFYSSYEHIAKDQSVYDFRSQQSRKIHIGTNLPTIILYKDNYYFANDKWYRYNEDGSWLQYSY
ncbi:hypothetical protein ABIB40_000599 [Pedobacter sp. UYP30]|uniref:hypothetical protein n=1 Tax=Pedobacter sp. UYP30 TaxID=1756400 RepID=UPI00339725EB